MKPTHRVVGTFRLVDGSIATADGDLYIAPGTSDEEVVDWLLDRVADEPRMAGASLLSLIAHAI